MDRDIPIVEYRARFADSQRQLADLVPEDSALPDDHRATVAATWSLSIQAADALQPAGLARPVLQLLSLLDPNGAPAPVLEEPPVLDLLGAIRRNGHPQAADVDAATARDALRCLYRLSLAETGGTDEWPTVRVHALVQRVTLEHTVSQQRDQAVRAVADALVTLWPRIERDTAAGQLLRINTDALRQHTDQAPWQPDAHGLLFRAGQSLGEAGQAAAAIRYFHNLSIASDRQLGLDHPDTLTTRSNLARWRGHAGDPAGAATAHQDLLTDCLRVLGPDHPHTLTIRSNLAYWRGRPRTVNSSRPSRPSLMSSATYAG
jgi:hypothetical protein